MSTETRRELLAEHREMAIRPRLSVFDKSLNPTQYAEWPSRRQLDRPRRANIVVAGPAGAGKTTYIRRLVSELVAHVDLVVWLKGADLRDIVNDKTAGSCALWGLIYRRFLHAGGNGLTPEAVSYALARRRTLLVLEDVHLAGPADEALRSLRGYLAKYHRARHCIILMTTRERIAEVDANPTQDLEILRLEPLSTTEPGEFFWKLCTQNGVEINAAETGRALSEAFTLPTTRTPLFVVICAWLAVNVEKYRANVAELLTRGRAGIFELFIQELCARHHGRLASEDPGDFLRSYERFLGLYERIALQFWPDAGRIRIGDLDAFLDQAGQAGEVWTAERLLQSGFLYHPPDDNVLSVSFPHQAIADYLAAKAMRDRQDFKPLQARVPTSTNLEGFVGFLAELIGESRHRAAETLVALARDELYAFTEVVKLRPDLLYGGEASWYERLVHESASWATPGAHRRQPIEVWSALHEAIAELWSPWLDHLYKMVNEAGASPQGVEALAVIGAPRCRDLLDRWLGRIGLPGRWVDSAESKAFRDASLSPPVRGFLIGVLGDDGVRTARGWNAFRLAWASGDVELRDAARRCAADHLAGKGVNALDSTIDKWVFQRAWESDDTSLRRAVVRWIEVFGPGQSAENLGRLIDLGPQALLALAQGCKDAPLERRVRIGRAVARRLGKVLISPGMYEVRLDGVSRPLRVNTPLLVPCKPRTEEGKFEKMKQALDAVRRKATLTTGSCMNMNQATIALNYFRDPEGIEGVQFPEKRSDHCEILFDQNKRLTLAAVTDPTRTGLQSYKASPHTSGVVVTRVTYRQVEFLTTDSTTVPGRR
jgi:hypothetical protein